MNHNWTAKDVMLMRRCFALARRGGLAVKSNPQVGALIICQDTIIAEGYHHAYGQAHAERDALNNVTPEDRHLLPASHMYVTLEPCGHHGKTPPCADAIIAAGIPEVSISNIDPTDKLQGKSVQRLRDEGIVVHTGLLEEEGRQLIAPFIAHQIHHRPYIILKWAQSLDGYMGAKEHQVWLSNSVAKLMVHDWRSQIDGIMVGTDTAITDNPKLTNRLVSGSSPHRYVLDRTGRLPADLHVLMDEHPTTVLSAVSDYPLRQAQKSVVEIPPQDWNLEHIIAAIHHMGTLHLMIEGGAQLLNSFIKNELWDEARIITTTGKLEKGIRAPRLKGRMIKSYKIDTNKVMIINRL